MTEKKESAETKWERMEREGAFKKWDDPNRVKMKFPLDKSYLTDICQNGMVMKTIIKDGIGYRIPEKHQKVTIRYKAWVHKTMKLFDSTEWHNDVPLEFKLGTGFCTNGLEFGVSTMRNKEICELIV